MLRRLLVWNLLDAAAVLPPRADDADLPRKKLEEESLNAQEWLEPYLAGVAVVAKWRLGVEAPLVYRVASCRWLLGILVGDLDGLFCAMVFAGAKEKDSTRAMRRACMNESGRARSGGHTSCFNRNREEADRRRAGKEERTPRLTDRVGRQVPREQVHSRGQARSSRSEARQDGRWAGGTVGLPRDDIPGGWILSVSTCVSWLPHVCTCG